MGRSIGPRDSGFVPGLKLVGLPRIEHGNVLARPYRAVYRLASSFRGQMSAAGDGYAFLFFVETVTVPSGRSPIS